jgi:hypothetical protein
VASIFPVQRTLTNAGLRPNLLDEKIKSAHYLPRKLIAGKSDQTMADSNKSKGVTDDGESFATCLRFRKSPALLFRCSAICVAKKFDAR